MKILNYSSNNFWKTLENAMAPNQSDKAISEVVSSVIADIKKNGDKALFDYTKKFDKASIKASNIRVSDAELNNAFKSIPDEFKKSIKDAIKNVEFFHKQTMPKSWRKKNPHGATIGENFYPINRVGLYIPGGQVPLVSTVVMTATLAVLAKCPEVCVCTPPDANGKVSDYLLCALKMLGIKEIYKAGGAQAIAAMAVGTKSIKAVDKIYGPGNAFVIEAKKQLFGIVGCDLLPGPSEVMIIADAKANPKFLAADLLSQAEHGSSKEKIYLAAPEALVEKVKREIASQSKILKRAEKLEKIINDSTYIIVAPNIKACAEVANYIAPEHLELQVANKDIDFLLKNLTTAGAILIGENTPTVLGDFCAGPSHTLPTGRTGRFSGGLQLIDFMRRSSIVKYDLPSAKKASKTVADFAKMEQLDAHGNSLKIRL